MSKELARNEILSEGPDDGDWSEVVRRARSAGRRRGVYGLTALIALVAVGVASAYALGYSVVDFGTAEKGSTNIVNDFGSMEVAAPEGMAPGVIPEQTRKIPGLFLNGEPYRLYVAPTKSGGFCTQHGCVSDPKLLNGRVGIGYTVGDEYGINQIGGEFTERGADRLEISYADGTSEDIPFVWVTEPIDAGFFVFAVPKEHQVRANRPLALAVLDDQGKILGREPISDTFKMADFETVTYDLPGYPNLEVPAKAIWEERRQLFDLRADDGARVGLWVAMGRDGSTCMWTNQSWGCLSPGQIEEIPALALGFASGATHVNLGYRVGVGVAKVEARFEDGDRVELTPKEGYLIWPIRSRHYPPGHRLEQLVAFDASGRVIAQQHVSVTERGRYPCEVPKDYGYGVEMCP